MARNILKYDCSDKLVSTYETLEDAVADDKNYKLFYYRLSPFSECGRIAVTTTHFGVTVTSKGNLRFDASDYMNAYLNDIVKYYDFSLSNSVNITSTRLLNSMWHRCKEWVLPLTHLPKDSFEKEVNTFLDNWSMFEEIEDLNEYNGKPGLYLMVLDGYNQCYIGQSNDIKKRIQRHWSRNDYFSGIGIDLFKALDTTRIYGYITEGDSYKYVDSFEYQATYSINTDYLLNRMAGGGVVEFLR